MNILVTGTAGFIGFHVVRKLLEKTNFNVYGIDNINDYYDVNLKMDRLAACGIEKSTISTVNFTNSTTNPRYRFQKLDIADRISLNDIFANEKFDYVINMAAQAGVRYSIENPAAYTQSNLIGFANLIECCQLYHIKHFVYASSSSVYGMKHKISFSEEDNVDYPVSFYAATKKSNELMAHSYSHIHHLPTTGVRLFTAYGTWGRPDMAPMLFAKAICNDESIRLFNNGDMLRDFTYVDDIAESIVRLIDKIPTEEEKHPFYRIFNIGSSAPVQLLDFVQTIEKAIGKKAILDMQPMQQGDVKETYANTSLLERCINFTPSTLLEDGIECFIKWYKEYYSK